MVRYFLGLFLFAITHSSFGQSTYLYLSESEMHKISGSTELVSAKIKELAAVVEAPVSISERIAALQTVILLEPYSFGAECDLSIVYAQMPELMMQMDATEAAILLCHKALFLGQECKRHDSPSIYNHLGRLGTFHMLSGNLDSALYFFRMAEVYSDTIADPIWHASALNNLGIAWVKFGQPDSAFSYFNQAIFGLNNSNSKHKRFMESVNDNLAEWHRDQGNYKVAIQFYHENISLCRFFSDTAQMIKSMLGLGKVQAITGELTMARSTLDSIEYWLVPFRPLTEQGAEQMCDYHRLKKTVFESSGDLKNALRSAEEALIWQSKADSLSQRTRQLMIGTLNHSEISRINQELALRNRLFRIEKESSRTQMISFGVIAILLLAVVFLAFSKRRKKKR